MKKNSEKIATGILVEFGFWTIVLCIQTIVIYVMFRVIP